MPEFPARLGTELGTAAALQKKTKENTASYPNVMAEAAVAALGSFGTATCLASSGFFISANCRVRPDAVGTATGRVGFAAGPLGRTLLYVKGGLAWLDDRIDITSNALAPPQVTSFDGARFGWTAGAGIERALTPAWSL